MILEDYGKMAYVKLLDVEKRLNKLENIQGDYNYSQLEFSFGSQKSITNYEKTFKVNALKEGVYTISGNVFTDLTSITGVTIRFYVGEVLCYSFVNNLDVEYPFSFKTSFLKGENTIKIIMSSNYDFNLDYINLSINGFVDYIKTYNRISHYTYNDFDYILHWCNNSAKLIKYTSDSGLLEKEVFNDCSWCNVLGSYNNNLYIAIIELNGNLSIKILNVDEGRITSKNLNISGVTSVAGYFNNGTFEILFCKLFMVYKGFYNPLTQSFTYLKTTNMGVKVFADANCPNFYVIVDRYNNAKFVTA